MSAGRQRIAVLFDIDGTLINSGGAGARSWLLAFDELYGVPADIGEFTDTGMTDPEVGRKTFEAVLEREVGAWLGAAPALPVVVSGMITSRQGWLEVPYCACPAGSVELAHALGALTTRGGRRLHFVPGVSLLGGDGVPDVIRGEETQIIGEVGDLPGRHRHRMPKGCRVPEIVFELREHVRLRPGGALARIVGAEDIVTNSLHGQAIRDPGRRVVLEGWAADGTIEAISIEGARSFAIGVQWHAEYDAGNDPVSRALFRAFGEAARGRRARAGRVRRRRDTLAPRTVG